MRLLSSPSSRNVLLKSERGSPTPYLQFLSSNKDSRINLNIAVGSPMKRMSPKSTVKSTRAVDRFDKSINQVYSPDRMHEMGAPTVEIGDAHHILHNYYKSKHSDKYDLQTKN